ncbi:N-acetylmuramoyl-L-alanine amidase [Thalassovita taeanensis]|uniref:N-acetylmuramoyl-L-alanine amidase n=1 Tax=Thalassovita taeanensis TaxID=657014 RepID=A0A1H8YS63_9RHOB|nr:N-acetylmuramoyl-L-alanine amidase [Thalassovita taeanensis]SEP55006.1 N-acetylmuramoyl-L-alanine amidase [Thalassovita taeanensis]
MSRIFKAIAVWALLGLTALPVAAQELSGLARVEVGGSQITDSWGGLRVRLALTQGVPFRAYTLDGPPRLVLDFREVDWQGVTKPVLLNADRATDLRFGTFRPGWSRMVVDLSGPLALSKVGMSIAPDSGKAVLTAELDEVAPEAFAALSGAPHDPRWDLPPPSARAMPPRIPGDGPLVVVLDPGHGGIDPGAEREGYQEKDLMLSFARELKETLLRSGGFEVVITREDDSFVSLERRIAIAHEAGAHVFLSLHADVLAEGQAHGATVHLLSDSATDKATALLAERHDRDDILSGVDLTGQDDVVAGVLMDLARQETQPRSERLALALVAGFEKAGAPLNRRPVRRAAFSVLKAADIPSLLLEVGFMSSPRDLKNLSNTQWRIGMAAAIRDGLRAWVAEDAALSHLVRQ